MDNIITVNIKKPLYNNHVYINGSIVEKAIRIGAKLEIIIPNGSAIVDPLEWKNNKDMMKKVFLYPDRPMILYGGTVPIHSSIDDKGEIIKEEIKSPKQSKLF